MKNLQPISARAYPRLPKLGRLRFTIKQLLGAFLLVSIALGAFVLVNEWNRRTEISHIYGSYKVYQLIRSCRTVDLYQVRLDQAPTNPAIDPVFPRVSLIHCPAIKNEEYMRLRSLLDDPQNFPNYAKDFIFDPTFMMRFKDVDGRDAEIYFCFRSNMAFVMVNRECIGILVTDIIAARLSEIFSSVCRGG